MEGEAIISCHCDNDTRELVVVIDEQVRVVVVGVPWVQVRAIDLMCPLQARRECLVEAEARAWADHSLGLIGRRRMKVGKEKQEPA